MKWKCGLLKLRLLSLSFSGVDGVFKENGKKVKKKWKCKILRKSESEILTFNLSLAAEDVIECALAGHQGEQAGRGHQQEEDGAHDGAG